MAKSPTTASRYDSAYSYYPHAPLPAHLAHWERLDDPATAHLVDAPWRHFEPFLAARGYSLCWRYYSREQPETPFRGKAFDYPLARDPFRPSSGTSEKPEGFVHLYDMDEETHRACGIHQTTGWMTQAATLKMAYDGQDRVCALKALHNTRSRAEIDIITFLNSPKMRAYADNHTIPVLDKIVTKEWTFIAMPYWPRSVQTCIPWEVDDYFNRLGQALEGLCFLHRHGIIHRDISAGNILLNVHTSTRGAYTPFTRLGAALAFIDFGCAVRFPAGSDPATWMGTGHWGTMDHVAPEVLRAARDRARSEESYHLPPVDVYALGSVFTRALSWERIHCSTFGNPSNLPTAAHQVLAAFVPEYEALLARMMDPEPARRPAAWAALRECRAMQAALDAKVRFAPPGGYPPLP